jgi:hypothetical protein
LAFKKPCCPPWKLLAGARWRAGGWALASSFPSDYTYSSFSILLPPFSFPRPTNTTATAVLPCPRYSCQKTISVQYFLYSITFRQTFSSVAPLTLDTNQSKEKLRKYILSLCLFWTICQPRPAHNERGRRYRIYSPDRRGTNRANCKLSLMVSCPGLSKSVETSNFRVLISRLMLR